MYRWARIKNGIGYAAIVDIEICPADNNQITENYTGSGFASQGHILSVPSHGHELWKHGAVKGLEYGLSLSDHNYHITIHEISGLITDTNATIVGYTALKAFCEKINLDLKESEVERLEKFVFSSWEKPDERQFPDFFSLTFTSQP